MIVFKAIYSKDFNSMGYKWVHIYEYVDIITNKWYNTKYKQSFRELLWLS
jgi:hypothetical protein